ncbi:MAG: hypothetical protein FWC34_10915 [Bacteroidetes bacterium]|nr:hypothetical protein [Bacteroidota bacterium]MCL2302947.1 hypothetical protein [Lentimicrobiaceae bacterium]
MNIDKYTRQELISIIEEIEQIFKRRQNIPSKNNSNKEELEELIGSLPFLFLNEKIFEKNLDISRFAEKIGVSIPSPEKKKKEDIIGRVIVAVSKFNKNKIKELNSIINNLKKNKKKSTKNNFFNEWEEAIKNINL